MDIYLPTASTPKVLNLFRKSRIRIIQSLLLMGGVLAMNGCLSLKFGGSSNSSQTTAPQITDLSGSSHGAQPAGPPQS